MNATRNALRVCAPAKINYGLRIVGRRPDGYHELDSLFLPLDLADEVVVRAEEGDSGSPVSIAFDLHFDAGTGPVSGEIPADGENLAVRAAHLFADAAGISCRLAISLAKRIPAAAGLGGGSSDAGAVLRALTRIFPEALSESALSELALGLGADVPFFLDPRPARIGGVGEVIEPRRVPGLTLLLANPGVPLSTAEVFRAWDAANADDAASEPHSLTRPSAASTMRPPAGPAQSDALPPGSAANDLESVAIALCPAIAALREGLAAAGAIEVGMSGSGPTVFGIFESRKAAEAASRAFTEAGRWRAGESEERRKVRIWARVASTLQSL